MADRVMRDTNEASLSVAMEADVVLESGVLSTSNIGVESGVLSALKDLVSA